MWNASSSVVNTGPPKVLDYQNMSLQCIVFSSSTCSQPAIELILESKEAQFRVDSMCIACKIKKLF